MDNSSYHIQMRNLEIKKTNWKPTRDSTDGHGKSTDRSNSEGWSTGIKEKTKVKDIVQVA